MFYSVKDLIAVLPEITLAVFAFIILFVDLWLPEKKKEFNGLLALLGVLVALGISAFSWNLNTSAFAGTIVVDRAATAGNIIILLVSFASILMGFDFLKREGIDKGEYYEVLLLSVVAMLVLSSTFNLVSAFVAIETLSIGMYVLTGFLRNKTESIEGAMKYFILGSFASSFLVLGIALLFGLFGSFDLTLIGHKLSSADSLHRWASILAFVLIFVGFGFKIAAFPFHAWTPDVYAAAPTPVSAFMSVAPKVAGFIILLRFLAVGLGGVHMEWAKLLWIVAAATMTVGNTVALWQKDLKRLLGYSSIAHAGYMLVGITAANQLGYGAVIFYLFGYLFMNLGAFAMAEFISQKEDRGTEIENLRGLGYRYPLLGLSMLLFMFGLAGVPPTVGFIGKYYLFSAAVKSHLYWLAVIGVINSAISAYFYLNIVVTMYMKGEPEKPIAVLDSLPLKVVVVLGAIGVTFVGIFPGSFLDVAMRSVLF